LPSVKAAEAIAQSLWRIYGPKVEVRFRDAGYAEIEAERRDRLTELGAEGVPLPTLFLDGELLYAGAINPLRVVAAVAEHMQGQPRRTQLEHSLD
jgi:hypothetical protein